MLERDFGFGVVRQLLEPATDEADAYEGVADPARAVLGDVGEDATGPDRSFAALHALFRLTAALAARQPLVLCIDDLQWSDLASLRFVAYLVRRLDGLPVLVAATVRTGEPSADDALMAELGQDPVEPGRPARAAEHRRHGGRRARAPGRRGRRGVRRRLPRGHGRQPAAAAASSSRRCRPSASPRTPPTPPRCARSARAP